MAKARKKDNQATPLPPGASGATVADNELSTLIDYVNSADDATGDSRELSEKCRRYYDSEQWTADERSKLSKQKQAATVINRIKPKMDGLMGMEKANRTTVKTFPRTPKHEKGATASTEAIRFVLQDNFYHQIRSSAWENALIEGTMGVDVIVKPKDGDYRVTLNHLMWDRLIYDPHSRRKDFSDARYLGQVVWMDYDEAAALYPDAKNILESMQTGSATYDDQPRWMDNKRRRVKIVELYYRRNGEIKYACFTRGGYCEEPKISPYLNEEGETEWPYEFASLFVERSGNRYGAVKQYLDVQDEINKRRSKALHLMSVRQVRGERGAVEDINKARQELAKPDGVLETTPGMEFEVLKTGDMAAAQFNLLAEAKLEIDSVGANSATMGKDKTVQSGVALRQRALTGQTELAPMFDVLKNLDLRVYRKAWNRIKQYWKGEMWLRVTDDENNLKFVGLNKPMTKGEVVLQEAQKQGATPEEIQALQQQISQDPMMSEVVSTENDIVNLDVDIVMDDAPDTVTQEVEDFQAMAEMVKSGFPIPPEAVIMASPLSNKDKILKMMKEQPQLPPQHMEQMKKMQDEFEKLMKENQQLKANQEVEAAKLQADTQIAITKAEIQRESKQMELQLERESAQAEIQLAREKASEIMMTKDHEMKKLDIEKEKLAISEKDKQAVKDEKEAKSFAPQILEHFKQMMETQNQFNKELITEIKKPKKITARSSSGATIEATTH